MKKDPGFLNYLLKTYDGLNKLIVSTKNRIQALNPEADPCHQDEIVIMQSLKGKISRRIEKELDLYPIWESWLIGIRGIGPFIAGKLIMLYYYRFVPICPECGTDYIEFICPDCGKKAKGGGVLKFRIEKKDFSTVSKWWAYMGRGHDENGNIVKRKKGEQSNWSTEGKMIGYQIGDQVNRQSEEHLYKKFLLERKKKREKTHPDVPKGHRHNMGLNETAKLFLSHFWHVARTLDGKSTEGPYVEVHLKHGHIIAPYYWDG